MSAEDGFLRELGANVMFDTGEIFDSLATIVESNRLTGPQAVDLLRQAARESREYSDATMRQART